MNVVDDNETRRTDMLAARLASETDTESKPVLPFAMPVACGVALAAASAFSVVLGVIGHRADLAQVWPLLTFLFKIVSMGLAAAGAFLLLLRAGTPGLPIRPLPVLLPAVAMLVAGAVLDPSGFPVAGQQTFSVLKCLGSIVLAALPALAVLLLTLRRGVPTDLAWAGAVAGLLAGSLGAFAYALACVNDGFAFVAVWYSVAIAIATAIGAAVGPRALAW